MVATRADVKENFLGGIREHGRDDRHIRQMRTTIVRVVQHIHIAPLHPAAVLTHHGLDALPHRAKMHGHMRRIGDEVALSVEQCATEIQALFDVHRVGRIGEPQPHLFGNRHEQIIEYFQHDRIGFRADRIADCTRDNACQHQMI